MYEILMVEGSKGRVFPNSGPGPKYAYGDEQLAYFGEVLSGEILNTSQLAEQLDMVLGNVKEHYPVWLKFYYKGQVLFIAKKPLVDDLSWSDLYLRGLVYGSDDDGSPASRWNLESTNQLRLVNKDHWKFKVRLIRDNPSKYYELTATENNSYGTDGEWIQLMYRVSANMPVDPEFPNVRGWESFTDSELGITGTEARTLLQGAKTNLLSFWARGNGVHRFTNTGPVQTPAAWRPVLELDTGNELYSPNRFRYRSTDSRQPPSIQSIHSLSEGRFGRTPTDAQILFSEAALLTPVKIRGGLLSTLQIPSPTTTKTRIDHISKVPSDVEVIYVTSPLLPPKRIRERMKTVATSILSPHFIKPTSSVLPHDSVTISFPS